MKDLSNLPKWAKITTSAGILAVLTSLGLSAWWNDAISPPTVGNSPEIQFNIPSGSSTNAVGKKLVENKIIKSEFAWKLWTSVFARQGGGPKMGNYQLSPSKSLPDIAAKLWSGRVTEVNFTIPEGSNIKRMNELLTQRFFPCVKVPNIKKAKATNGSIPTEVCSDAAEINANLTQKGFFPKDAFIKETQNIPRDKFPWLPEGIKDLEGFLFPNTYSIPKEGITPRKVITQMLQQFEKDALPIYKAQGANSNLSLLKWVSLSSVVEKEAVIPTERPLIAGVFVNRLSKGIKLESDPTVEYAFGIKQTPDRPLYFSEIRKPHPYNTYTTPGIPPGPIASPGLASLKAVLAPNSTDMLFFVAKYDGTHVFSKTNAEHEQATRAIRAGRQQIQKK
jgi:UPF0755 protein